MEPKDVVNEVVKALVHRIKDLEMELNIEKWSKEKLEKELEGMKEAMLTKEEKE